VLLLFDIAAAVSVTFPGDVRQAAGLDPASAEFAEVTPSNCDGRYAASL
jgi:hypothetical protein